MRSAVFIVATILVSMALITEVSAETVVAACHNATGSCTHAGFVCANSEVIPNSKRCDGIEDCADGTDEYMCHLPATALMEHERRAEQEVACVKCFCQVGTVTIVKTTASATWWKTAITAPRDFSMMAITGTSQSGRGCSETYTGSVELAVYKKNNKGCRGWVCCLRQKSCAVCSGGMTAAKQCNAV